MGLRSPFGERFHFVSRFDTRAYLALVALALVWGYNWVAIRVATAEITPYALAALRTVVGGAILFALVALLRRPWRSPPVLPTAALGLLNITGFFVFQTLAVAASGAGRSAVLAYTYPFWTALLAWPLLGDRIAGRTWLGLAIAAVGLGFVLAPIDFVHEPLGKLFALLTALDWSLATIATKRFREQHEVDVISFTAWQTVYGAIPLIVIALLVPGERIHPSPTLFWSVAYIGICGTGLGYLLWLFALNRLRASAASLTTLLTPIVTVLVASFQLGEVPSRNELIGIIAILCALALNAL
jgi:drug/metabolite transporter (DMT)-like permease